MSFFKALLGMFDFAQKARAADEDRLLSSVDGIVKLRRACGTLFVKYAKLDALGSAGLVERLEQFCPGEGVVLQQQLVQHSKTAKLLEMLLDLHGRAPESVEPDDLEQLQTLVNEELRSVDLYLTRCRIR